MNYSVGALLDGVRRADLGAGRVLTVHADLRRRLNRLGPVYVLQVDHRNAAVSAALCTGLHARLASDAAGGVQDKDVFQITTPARLDSGPGTVIGIPFPDSRPDGLNGASPEWRIQPPLSYE